MFRGSHISQELSSRRKTGARLNKQDSGVAPTLTIGASAGKSEKWTVLFMRKRKAFPPVREADMWAAFRSELERDSQKIYSTNSERYAEMQTSYKLLAELFPESEFECRLREGMRSIGEIEFTCDEIQITTSRMPQFVQALALASNICIHRYDASLMCGLSFNDVLRFERDHF